MPKEKPALSVQRIVESAMTIADQAGLDALSMRKIAKSLSVEAMSLYNYLQNKELLLDAMVEAVVAKIDLPDPALPWKMEMKKRCSSAYQVLKTHPWAAHLLMARLNVGPAMLRYVDASHGCLLMAGFSHKDADLARNLLDSYIYGFTLQELTFPIEPDDYASTAAEFQPRLDSSVYPYLTALAAEVASGRYDGKLQLEFGLELLLEALESKQKSKLKS
ncbi:TetR/AcrR family transcriptional regulator C-terminal domain-containing protein [Rheinheimera soli]|jgi:AcrR family transcriptional regulator|uniref:AcrR family transcriptional regulator n=1 Tax=Rheinheimera soli TaxID=443616 RepID=A0ABU1VWB9_9GAMM|nr:TetR/AcrR family transcriptional regulator C-terminal domain-containing protein [Rheinheimera soli]MDR7119678.1 AcrR family transcriptional regulator [Rheinheimera soli]